jgi:HSP20 family protein
MNLISRTNGLAPRRVDLFSEVSRELDHMFNEVFAAPYFAGKKSKGYPLMDAVRSKDALTLQYTVPGVKPEDLDVEISKDEQGRLLTVSGRLSGDYTYEEGEYHIRELSSKEFRRVIRLPEDLTEDDPETTLRDGVLRVLFKTAKSVDEPPQSKKLNVRTD